MKKSTSKISTENSNGLRSKKIQKPSLTAKSKSIAKKPAGKLTKGLQAAQELQLLLNNTEEGFLVVGSDLRIITFNNQFKKLYFNFFDREVMKNESILEYAPANRKEIVEQIYHKVFTGEKLESETIIDSKTSQFTFANKFKPAYDEDGVIIGAVVTTIDITEKKRSQQLLASNEQRFQALVENSSDGIIILLADGKASYVSPAVEFILGYTEKEALVQDMYKLVHPDDLHVVNATMQKAMENPGQPIESEAARVLHKDGSWRWLEATITNMLHDPSIHGIVDNFRDVTDKIVAEQELKQSREQLRKERVLLRTLIDNLPINVYTKDLNSRKTLSNRRDFEYSGFSSESDALGKTDREVFSVGSADNTIAEDQLIFATGQSIIDKEEHHYKKDGSDTWFLISKIPLKNDMGKITGLLGISYDISERKESEEKIRLAKERYDIVAKATNEAIWDWDMVTDEVQWGEGFKKLFGLDPQKDTPTFNTWSAHLHPDDASRIIQSIMKVVCSPTESQWQGEYRLRKADGTYASVFDRGYVIRDTEGRPTRMMGGILDMTEKIEAQQALRDSEEKTRLIMNAALDAIIFMDAKGHITFWNPQSEKIFGWTAEEAVGRVLSELIIPPKFRSMHDKGLDNYLKTGHGPALNVLLELSAINRDNKEFPIELTILPIKQDKGEFFCAFVRDITTRKFIKQQLNDALDFNKSIIETSPVGIWIYEESGQAISVNKAAIQLAGTDAQDLLGINFRENESWKEVGLYEAAMEAMETGNMVRKEIHGYNRANVETWYDALLSTVQYKGKSHLMLMTFDIRDRMLAEMALKKSKTQLSVATELAMLGYWELDIDTGIFTFNEQLFSILKTTSQEMGGYQVPASIYGERFMHPDDNQLVQDEIRMAIETTDPNYSRHIEHRIIHPDGSIGYLAVRFFVVKDAQGRTIRTIGANQDITEQVMAAEQIKLVKERYEMVNKATSDAIYEWDIINNYNYWGEGYETLFGHKRTSDKMDSSSWVDNLHPDEREELMAVALKAFQEKRTSLRREMRFRCADGSYKTVFDNLIILYNSSGEPQKIVGAMQDITALKKNELAIKELNERLNKRAEELATSNAELERFAYVASHDLQEPLRMVSSFLQLLEKKYRDQLDETAQQYINYAVDGADRMKRLILDLLEFSRLGTQKDDRVKTDLNQVTKHVLEIFADKTLNTGATVKVHPLPVIRVNSVQITQLLQNLVGNAFKYNNSVAPVIEIGCEEKEKEWQFFVKDNGIGIDPKFFEKVFVIFQRLHNKNQFSGTGIGLAICKKIVERHGGNIWIESSVGNGSTFFFTIKK